MCSSQPAEPTLPLRANEILRNGYEESMLVTAYINTQCPSFNVGFLLMKMLHNKPQGGYSLCFALKQDKK